MCIKGTKKDEQIVELVIIESHFPVQNFLWRTLYLTVDCPYDREYCSWQWDVVHGKKVLSVTGDNVHGRTDILSMAGDTVLAIFCLHHCLNEYHVGVVFEHGFLLIGWLFFQKYKWVNRTTTSPGAMLKNEKPLMVTTEVALVDPSDG